MGKDANVKRYFTFGWTHSLPGVSSAAGEYVVVDAPSRHREIFLGWLGSSRFAFEYSQEDWLKRQIGNQYDGRPPIVTITVTNTSSESSETSTTT